MNWLVENALVLFGIFCIVMGLGVVMALGHHLKDDDNEKDN